MRVLSIQEVGKQTIVVNSNFDYGCIIAKCQLVDCICMDKPFIQEVSKKLQ